MKNQLNNNERDKLRIFLEALKGMRELTGQYGAYSCFGYWHNCPEEDDTLICKVCRELESHYFGTKLKRILGQVSK